MRNLGETVKRNPMPLALVGVGLAWMMLGDRRDRYARSPYWDEDDDLAYGADRDDADLHPEDDPYTVGVSASAYGTGAATTVEHENREGWADRAKATAEGARDKAAELRERARGLAEDATAGAGRLGAAARERLSRARALAGRAGEGRALAGRYGRRARRGFLHTLDEHPLVLGAIGLAVGAAIGSALPPSEPEDRLMGETRDRLKRAGGQDRPRAGQEGRSGRRGRLRCRARGGGTAGPDARGGDAGRQGRHSGGAPEGRAGRRGGGKRGAQRGGRGQQTRGSSVIGRQNRLCRQLSSMRG